MSRHKTVFASVLLILSLLTVNNALILAQVTDSRTLSSTGSIVASTASDPVIPPTGGGGGGGGSSGGGSSPPPQDDPSDPSPVEGTLDSWRIIDGLWSITDGVANPAFNLVTEATGRTIIVVDESLGDDYEIHTRVMAVSGSSVIEPQIVFRLVDGDNYYFAGVGVWGYKAGVGRMINGQAVRIAEGGNSGYSDLETDTWYELDLVVDGNTFTVYMDGEKVCEAVDSTHTSGQLGFTSYNTDALYDYIKVVDAQEPEDILFSDYFGGSSRTAIDDFDYTDRQPAPPSNPDNVNGVTYLSNNWRYQESESIIRRDFQYFQDQGITIICLLTHWQDFEPSRDNYDEALFSRMKNVASIADEYGIKVIFNIHTTYKGNDVPNYVGNFGNLFTNPSLYEAHLDALRVFCSRLDGSNVYGFQIHNEPVNDDWGVPAGLEEWIQLFADSVDACKEVTNKPISCRFAAGSFYTFDDRVFDIFDFMSVNYYQQYHSESNVINAIQKTHQRGKIVVMSEFGLDTTNDESQSQPIQYYLNFFADNDVEYTTAWWYCGLRGPSSYGYNLFDYDSGTPRPSFYEIGLANGY
jgi:hypothetical protein